MRKTLVRSEENRFIAGVCGGLGDYFDIDATIFRVVFVVTACVGGSGILVYLLLWVIIPNASADANDPKSRIADFKKEAREFVEFSAEGMKKTIEQEKNFRVSRTRNVLAITLIIIGGIIILHNIVPHISFQYAWPAILIVLGVWLLWQAQPEREKEEENEKPKDDEDIKDDTAPIDKK